MPKLHDAGGEEAVVGRSRGYWLASEDFLSTEEGAVDPRRLGTLGFPRDWPAVYTQNAALKSLLGKRGRLASKRVAVAGAPDPEERARVQSLSFHPLQSFLNAERAAEQALGLVVVRGWAVFERFDRPSGTVFVAERYWWNALPDGKWVDLTPRPEMLTSLLLAEPVAGAPKSQSVLTALEEDIAACLFAQRFPTAAKPRPAPALTPAPAPAASAARPQKPEEAKPRPKPKAAGGSPSLKPAQAPQVHAKVSGDKMAAPLDYSKWNNIVDSDDEDDGRAGDAASAEPREQLEDYGVKDLAESQQARRQPPVPDYLIGNTGGGGGTNCFQSIVRLLDADFRSDKETDQTHQLSQAFGKIFHCAVLDDERQRFYRDSLAAVPPDAFVIVLGIGSILPMFTAARRKRGRGVLLEYSAKLSKVAKDLLKANNLEFSVVHVPDGFDKDEPMKRALQEAIPADAEHVVILTERLAHDMLSDGIVPACVAAHTAVRACSPKAQIQHIPRTVELQATPIELRFERLAEFDLRPFNAFRHTSSNDKADFWWWAVRLDNQPNTRVLLLGPSQTLCGFDFDRSPEITLEEVRTTLKLEITQRGRCNGIALWWTARCGGLEYSTRPKMAGGSAGAGGEWKQPVHYLAGETAVFVGDTLEVLASITPRFTVRMMQQSPFSVEAPPWITAPTHAKFSATLPILPYHFLMLTDLERLKVYQDGIRAAVRLQKKKLGRRVRVLDAGCGIGVLGMTAAMEGADVWLCEAMPIMRQMCREVVAVNASAIAEKRGLVQLLPPMMSSRLEIGDHVEEKFDIVISEVMDLWCLGEGVVPTMRHAYNKLLADGGLMLPSRLVIFVQPVELLIWSQVERDHKVSLSAMNTSFKSKFTPLRIDQYQHRWLTDEPIPALEIDLKNVPVQPADGEPNLEGVKLCIRMGGRPALRAKISPATVDRSGMLCGYGIWWSADLGNGHVITSAPSSPQRSWKQLMRWLDEPRFVSEGEEIQVLACYNDTQINVEDIHMPQEMVDQYQEQLHAEQHQQQQQQPQQQQQQQQQPQRLAAAAKATPHTTTADVAAAAARARLAAPAAAPVAGKKPAPTSAAAKEKQKLMMEEDDDVVEVD